MAIAKDMRKSQAMTVEQADKLFLEYAGLILDVKRVTAKADKRKAEIDAQTVEATRDAAARAESLRTALSDYISAHRERFIRPRKHKVGTAGTYGIETVSGKVAEITDAEALRGYSDATGLELYKLEIVPDKSAIAEVYTGGGIVPGVEFVPPGEAVKITVAKNFIEEHLTKG